MIAFITLLLGFILGVFIHILTMKINFKQRTIDNKIKIYDSLIISWVKMRNHIYDAENPQHKWNQLDQIYGTTQTYIGEIFLVTENDNLAKTIDEFNEKFYRQNWHSLDFNSSNQVIAKLKEEALEIISRMKQDIQDSTVLTWSDIVHICNILKKNKNRV